MRLNRMGPVTAMVLVLVCACSSADETTNDEAGAGSSASTSPTPSPSAEPREAPRDLLRRTRAELARTTRGAYGWLIEMAGQDVPVLAEQATYDRPNRVIELARSVRDLRADHPSDETTVIRVRSAPDGLYVQADVGGSRAYCWRDMHEAGPEDLRGLPRTPLPVEVLLGARVARKGQEPTSRPPGPPEGVRVLTVVTDGAAALELLSMDDGVERLSERASAVDVPARLWFRDGELSRLTLIGLDVALELKRAGVGLGSATRLVASLAATVDFSEATLAVELERPSPSEVLPPGVDDWDGCRAAQGFQG